MADYVSINRNNRAIKIAVIGSILIALILVVSTLWLVQTAKRDNEIAVNTVSLMYLDELAGRREQVVDNNLQNRIRDLRTAVGLMDEEDLSDLDHLQAYQSRMKRLYVLDKFAFVDENGLIYTSLGPQDNIAEYAFDYLTISAPEISILNLNSSEKKVVIAVPVDIPFDGHTLMVCFMEIDMDEMLSGVSMASDEDDTTFCNIYTHDGVALTDSILGGLAQEDNLIEAMRNADYDDGYSYERFLDEFENGVSGKVSFTYNGIRETLSYVPVDNTDWNLTYLVRESVISENISGLTNGMIIRGVILSILTVLAVAVLFLVILSETRRNTRLLLESQTAQAEVKAAVEANKAKSAFLSNMSHEIRTPMNAIIGLDNIALNDPETPESTKEYLRKISSSAEHLLNIINDILDMSRIESGKLTLKNEEFSFSKLLETINVMISGQCNDKGVEYQCHISPDIEDYYVGDNVKIRQVLINVLGNAVKFTPEGGQVSLDVKRKAHYDGHSTIEFTVADTGIGISEDFMPHLFDTFAQEDSSATNRYGSSGLGLAITKNIVEMMNGDISAVSTKGKGTTFTIVITLDDAEHEDEDMVDKIDPSTMSVLVIDDDPVACEHTKLILGNAGIACEIASSGAEAVEKVKLRHARRDPYNLILVDWQMPEMDGIETTRKIREIIGNESAIIILTAYRWDDILEEALSAGVDSFIAKPVFVNSVIDEFKTALRNKNAMLEELSKVDLTGRHILLAEDVDVNAEIMMMVLSSKQIEAERAENGKVAVDMFRDHEEGYYDAILMDMRMPEMDGLEATRIIRAMDRKDSKKIPIIALTANAFDEDVQRSLQAGLNAHLSKPVQPESLFETLELYIGKREKEDEKIQND